MSQFDKVFLASSSKTVFLSSVVTPAATAAASCVEQAFTITGQPSVLFATDHVGINPASGSGNALGIGGVRINATGQLVINFLNPTAGALTYPAQTFTVVIHRP